MPHDEDSKKLLAINTHKGLYEYNRLTFGIASAPSIWQRDMDQNLQGLSGVQCVLDDMIITGKMMMNIYKILKMYFKGCRTMGSGHTLKVFIFTRRYNLLWTRNK
jgi:hypothetical protein